MPLAIYALTAGAFGIGVTEFVIMGLLPQVAADIHVSIASAGLLISGYALGVVVGAPVLTILTDRYPRKAVLMGLIFLSSGTGHDDAVDRFAQRDQPEDDPLRKDPGVDWSVLHGVGTLGITAGASAPELLVRELVDRLSTRFDVTEREVELNRETIAFKLPRGLEAVA